LIAAQRDACDAVRAATPCREIERGNAMNQDIIAGNWKQLKGKIQAKWGDLTDDDFKVAQGNAEYLEGKLQERYGYDRDRAHTEVEDFRRSLRDDTSMRH
jgi:uncharacterized protein YjbJ (UPF0337 family)